jgi:hypothetical protein
MLFQYIVPKKVTIPQVILTQQKAAPIKNTPFSPSKHEIRGRFALLLGQNDPTYIGFFITHTRMGGKKSKVDFF